LSSKFISGNDFTSASLLAKIRTFAAFYDTMSLFSVELQLKVATRHVRNLAEKLKMSFDFMFAYLFGCLPTDLICAHFSQSVHQFITAKAPFGL